MSKKDEALKLALEALEYIHEGANNQGPHTGISWRCVSNKAEPAITALRQALANEALDKMAENARELGLDYEPAQQECNHCGGTGDVSGEYPGVACPECSGSGVQAQPDFIKHEVENAYDWSEWVCPDPESYLMKCCDCGLVHEAQFRVAKYKPAPSDECEVVSDPDLQAQFRMRRSEQWSPADTAHRPGGLPMAEQPAQQEPVAWVGSLKDPQPHCVTDLKYCSAAQWDTGYHLKYIPLYTSPQPSKPWVGLTKEDKREIIEATERDDRGYVMALVEAKLREKNNG